jgi:hypothetical protein
MIRTCIKCKNKKDNRDFRKLSTRNRICDHCRDAPKIVKNCSVIGCKNKHVAKGFCGTHYPPNKGALKRYHKTEKFKKLNYFRIKLRRAKKQIKLAKMFKNEIIKIYSECPKNMVVDHIVPLINENISGLHVPWNFEYLTKYKNSTKSNKFDFTNDNTSWRKDVIKTKSPNK